MRTEADIRALVAPLDAVTFDQQRRALAKQHSIRLETLDDIWRESRKAAAQSLTAQPTMLWPEPVNGEQLLLGLYHALDRFLIVSPEATLAIALWILHSHAHAAATKSPILLIWGPMPDCGKSTALDIVSKLVSNVLRGTGLTLAYVLRKASGRTVCWDEIDKELHRKGQNIDGWFTCGYQRGRVFGRCEGDGNTPTDYDPWCPKCVAMIGQPSDEQILSRCLPIEMRRKLEGEDVEEYFDDAEYPELLELNQKAARWASDHMDRLRKARPEKPAGLRGTRPFDNWRPLLAIADEIGGEWPALAQAAALSLQPRNDQDRTRELLSDLRELFGEKPSVVFWKTADILEHLKSREDREYETINRGRSISGKWLATQLSQFRIESDQPWVNGSKSKRGYHVAHFADAFERYLSPPAELSDPSDPSDPATSGNGSDGSDGSDGIGGGREVLDDPTAELF